MLDEQNIVRRDSTATRPRSMRRTSSFSALSWTLILLIGLICTVQIVLLGGSSSLLLSGSFLLPLATNTTTLRNNTTTRNISSTSWAYVFLMSDCDPTAAQASYRGMFYNILAATYVLKYYEGEGAEVKDGSPPSFSSLADIVVLVQMTATTPAERLANKEEDLLHQMGIQVRYLPRSNRHSQTFFELVMAKFHVLTMTEYSKIIFLDGDVLPLCNLDYLFQLSSISDKTDPHALGDTLLHAMYEDPVNAGLFLITPRHDIDELEKIMTQWNALLATQMKQRPRVDYRLWKGQTQSGWDFYCGDSDQGFLLYYSLFLQSKSVSIVVGTIIEHYYQDSASSGTVVGQPADQRQPTRTVSSQMLDKYSCLPRNLTYGPSWAQNSNAQAAKWPFYRDFYHMVGYSKAWETPPKSPYWNQVPKHELISSRDYWYWILQRVVEIWDPNHAVIPHPLEQLSQRIGKPKLRGDLLFTKSNPT